MSKKYEGLKTKGLGFIDEQKILANIERTKRLCDYLSKEFKIDTPIPNEDGNIIGLFTMISRKGLKKV